jgi:hypothetical protein
VIPPHNSPQSIAFQAKLKQELLQEDNQKSPSKKKRNKSKGRLCKPPSKRAKFLQNPNNRKDPKERREKTEAWFPKK